MNLEILAPAGSPESLRAAIYCGADAVYLGGAGLLNARRNAAGFDENELADAVSFCHGRGARVYLTLNTLVRETERDLLLRALEHACAIGVDAVLVQDLAVAATIRSACPGLALHASTQMGITGVAGVQLVEEMGFSRVVLGRELSLQEIAQIRSHTKVELEVFVHGALCMSVSGQCYLSSVIGARSGNRGLCAQPCRLPFECGKSGHALSLRDLSLLGRLKDLAGAGVCCVKIEGRMKRPEYVAAAVSACVAAREGREYDAESLAAVFSRSGFTQGYLNGQRDGSMFGIRQKEDVTAATAKLLRSFENLYRKELPRVPIDLHLDMHLGAAATLTIRDDDGFCTTTIGDESVQQAQTAPTTQEKAAAALAKTGGTPFYVRNIASTIDPAAMLPASAMNELRRKALEAHLALRSKPKPHAYDGKAASLVWEHAAARPAKRGKPSARVRLGRADQLEAALAFDCSMVTLPLHLWELADRALLAASLPRLAVELPRCVFGQDETLAKKLEAIRAFGVEKAVVSSLGGIQQARAVGFELHGGAFLNIFNSPALAEYKKLGLASGTLSWELALHEILRIQPVTQKGVLAYGYLPLMALRNCPAKAHGERCTGTGCGYPTLTDRMGKAFFLDCDGRVTTLHNCVLLWMADRLDELRELDFYTIFLTKETPRQSGEVLHAFASGSKPEFDFTRGLYYRSENAATQPKI